MFTDPRRIKLADPGHPEECNVYTYYQVFAPEKTKDVYDWCSGAKKGCTDCKKILAESLVNHLKSIREKRVELARDKNRIMDILQDGKARAQKVAQQTMREVKEIIFK